MDKRPITSKIEFILSYGEDRLQKLTEQLRHDIVEKLGNFYQFGDFIHIIEVARDIISQYEPLLAKILSDSQIAAWATGVDNVIKSLPEYIPAETPIALPLQINNSLPFSGIEPQIADSHFDIPLLTKIDLAVKDLKSRTIVTRHQFDQLSEHVKQQSFTVARQDSIDTIDLIRNAVANSIQNGIGKQSFQEELDKVFESSPMSKGHQNLVYRQSTLSSLAAGQESIAQLQEIKDAFPFAAYYATHDDRCRPEHRSLETSGLLLSSGGLSNVYWADDHEFWSIFTCPIDFCCRCTKLFIGLLQAAQMGVEVAQEWLRTGIRPKKNSCISNVHFRPTPGFVCGGGYLAV